MAGKNEARIDITAEDKEASTVFNRVGANLKGLDEKAGLVSRGFDDIAGSIGRLGAAAGFGVVVSGLARVVSGSVEAAASIQDMVEITGGSANGLSAIANEAETAGVELGAVTEALVKLERNLSSQDEDGGKTAKALKAIGLSAKELKDLSADERLFAISKALDEYSDKGGKAAVVSDIFGKGAAVLIPLLNDLAQRSELVGTVTKEQAAEADNLDKTWKETKQSMTLAARAMGNELIPWLSRSTQVIRESQKEYGAFLGFFAGLGSVISNTFRGIDLSPLEAVDAKIVATSNSLREARAKLEAAVNQPASGSAAAQEQRQRIIDLETQRVARLTRELVDQLKVRQQIKGESASSAAKPDLAYSSDTSGDERAAKAAERAKETYDNLIRSINQKIAASQAETAAGRELNSAEAERVRVLADIEKGYLKLTPEQEKAVRSKLDEAVAAEEANRIKRDAIKLSEEELRKTEAATQAFIKEAEALAEASQSRVDRALYGQDEKQRKDMARDISELQQRMADGKITTEEYAQAIRKLTNQQDGKDLSTWAQIGAEGVEALTTALSTAAIDGKLDAQGLADAFETEIKRMIIQILIIKPLLTSLGTALGGSKNGSANDGIWAQLGTSLIKQYGGGKAKGGRVTSNSFYDVVEEGIPELLHTDDGRTLLMGADGYVEPLRAPSSSGSPAATAVPQVGKVEIINNGTPQQIKKVSQEQRGDEWVTRVFLSDMKTGGPMSQYLKAIGG